MTQKDFPDVIKKKMTKNDSIIKYKDAVIQHGPLNNRIYLMKPGSVEAGELLAFINNLAKENSYTKIFTKIPASLKEYFEADCYMREAYIPKFYKFREDACFMCKYPDPQRGKDPDEEKIADIIETANQKEFEEDLPETEECFNFTECSSENAAQMAELYREVFATYPFPIHEPGYILKTMQENIQYYGIFKDNKLVALSSSEIDFENQNAEMTDFATLPESRGNSLALYLLKKMEEEMNKQGIKTLYTIARAMSYGMNITFSKAGYNFSGTLIKNTNISGRFESMNVWYKLVL